MNFQFRKLQRDDLELVLSWRQQEHVNQFMLTKFKGNMEQQVKWFDNVVSKPDRNYWIIGLDSYPVGVLNLIDLTYPNQHTADAGFYIGEKKYSNFSGFILPYFYNHIFDTCDFQTILGNVVKGNPILSMHLFHGYVVKLEKTILTADGRDVICNEVELTKESWRKNMKLQNKKIVFE